MRRSVAGKYPWLRSHRCGAAARPTAGPVSSRAVQEGGGTEPAQRAAEARGGAREQRLAERHGDQEDEEPVEDVVDQREAPRNCSARRRAPGATTMVISSPSSESVSSRRFSESMRRDSAPPIGLGRDGGSRDARGNAGACPPAAQPVGRPGKWRGVREEHREVAATVSVALKAVSGGERIHSIPETATVRGEHADRAPGASKFASPSRGSASRSRARSCSTR